MDLENLQKELFERKFKFGENIKVSFEFLKRFMKENRKLVSILYVCLVVSTMISIYLVSMMAFSKKIYMKTGIIIQEYYTLKMLMFMSIMTILSFVVMVTVNIIAKIILLKTSERIENQKTDLRKMTIFLKLLIIYVVFFIVEILFTFLMEIFFYLFFNGKLTTEITTIIRSLILTIFLLFGFPYFEQIFFIRNKSITDSLKGNRVLAKRNRIRLVAPIAILSLVRMFLSMIILFGNGYLVFNTDFSLLQILILGIPIAIIFGIIELFIVLYSNILSGIIFLNVEYQYLKENGNENDRNM